VYDARVEDATLPSAPAPSRVLPPGAIAFACIAAAFCAMAAWTWGGWPDVLVDFGHNLYLPWQIQEGKALGRDFEALGEGPLSQYLHAGLFVALGPALRVIVFANLAVLAAIAWALLSALRQLSDRATATFAVVVFLAVFAFGQYTVIGNYNYVTPYAHGATHGLLLSLAGVLLLDRHLRRGERWPVAAAGAALGFLTLTKPEMFVAAAAAFGIGMAAAVPAARGGRERAGLVLRFATPAVAVPLGAVALLATRMPARLAAQVATGPWALLGTPFASNTFYLNVLGLDAPGANVSKLVAALAGYTALLVPAAAADLWLSRRAAARAPIAACSGLAAFAAVAFVAPDAIVPHLGRPLPVFAAAGVVAYGVAALRLRRRGRVPVRVVLGLMLAVFAAALLLKMILNARIFHYGFVLAMPASLLGIVWLVHGIPRFLSSRGGSGVVFRAAAVGAIVAVVVLHLRVTSAAHAEKTFPVGVGADEFLADARGAFVTEMARSIVELTPEGGTLAVLPEGVMVNYLTRRPSPSRYLHMLPIDMESHGENRMIEDLQRAPPDLVLVIHRDASEFGPLLFGWDYGRATRFWIEETYAPAASVGAGAFEPFAYGMTLFARRHAK